MSIFERIQRITKANIDWLLNRIEPPEQELASRIKELETALEEGRECAASYGATFRRMQRELVELQKQQTQWYQKAEHALKEGNEDVARKALDEKVRLQERIDQLQPGAKQGEATYQQLRDNLLKLQDQLRSAKLKLAELKSRKQAAEAHKAFGKHLDTVTPATGQGLAFERLEDEVNQVEAEVEISEEIRAGTMAMKDLEESSRDLQVDAELRAMKEKLENH